MQIWARAFFESQPCHLEPVHNLIPQPCFFVNKSLERPFRYRFKHLENFSGLNPVAGAVNVAASCVQADGHTSFSSDGNRFETRHTDHPHIPGSSQSEREAGPNAQSGVGARSGSDGDQVGVRTEVGSSEQCLNPLEDDFGVGASDIFTVLERECLVLAVHL
jgi:hypothetical protein